MVNIIQHWRLIISTAFHGIAGYCAFFFMTLLSPIELWVKEFANQSLKAHYGAELSEENIEWFWAGISSSQLIGIMICSATIKYPAEKFGRRNTVMILKNIVVLAAGFLQFISVPLNSIELLVIGRMLDGASLIQTLLISVFLAESSPTEVRGVVSSAPMLGGRVWALAGSLLPLLNIFNSETTWHYLFLCPIIPALLHLLATPLIPQSIKHVYITKNNKKLSRKSSKFYHGRNLNRKKLEQEMDKEAEISPTLKIANIKVLFAAKQFRQPFLICLVAILMWPVGGDHIVNQYSTGLLRSFGISPSQAPFYNAITVQIPVFVVTLIGVLCLEKYGRRPLLLLGVGLATLGTGVLTLATPSGSISSSITPVVTILGLILTVVGLTIGANLVSLVLPGELAPQASRSLTFGIARLLGSILLLFFSFVTPPLTVAIGSYSMLPLPLLGVLGFAFLFKFLPESKGKTVREIVEPWMPKRKIELAAIPEVIEPPNTENDYSPNNVSVEVTKF